MNTPPLAPWILAASLALTSVACSGDAASRMPDKTKEAIENPTPVQLPPWTQGAYPAEPSFFGYGEATTQVGEDQAKAKALELIKLELGVLTRNIKGDHEEQVAEIISRYSSEDFDAHVDAVAAAVLEKAERVERFDDTSRSRLYVLYKLPFNTFYEALYARDGLPDEQKNRVKTYEGTFTDVTLKGLDRSSEE